MTTTSKWLRGCSVVMIVASVLLGLLVTRAHAQSPDDQALRIEHKLLCPQCTNLRLDVCDTPICADMRAEVRDRVAQGQSEQQIVDYFEGRFGQRVLAEVPRRGFNLVLFGWVGASILLVAVVGTWVLQRLRRTATPAATVLEDRDERWLDEQLAADREPR